MTTNFNKNVSTAMVLLDLEKAFDTVWHQGLICKLSEFNFPLYLIKITQSYLRDRTFIVTANGTQSNEQHIEAGVPQGFILGPLYILYYVNDIPSIEGTRRSLFADDTSLYAASWSTRKALHELQEFTNLVIQIL